MTMKLGAALTGAALLLASPVMGQTITGNYPALPTLADQLGVSQLAPTSILPSDLLTTSRIENVPYDGGSSVEVVGYSALPLSDFASAGSVSSLQSQVQNLAAQYAHLASETRWKLTNGIALASTLDMVRPAAGDANRFGGLMSAFDGRLAAGANYMRQEGRFDIGVAGGFANGASMGKASVGVSW